MYIQYYDCMTAAGVGADRLMEALEQGRDCSQMSESNSKSCLIPDLKNHAASKREQFQFLTNELWSGLTKSLSPTQKRNLKESRVALVFASTKGVVEDYVWNSTAESIRHHEDPFQVIIEDFCQSHAEISWQFRCNISNACSSSHVACEYIQTLFESDRADYALLIAADLIGPFVTKGFSSLKLISPTSNRPFSEGRDGLQLGEAASMLLFSSQPKNEGPQIQISQVASHTEGTSVTRPSDNGNGLVSAMKALQNRQHKVAPDLVIAHGTGTQFNDLAEELALRQFLGDVRTPVTGTKWCIGHTLGASGSIDLIAGCEVLKRQKAFRIQNTTTIDLNFKMNYLTATSALSELTSFQQVLINSLGFGGVHAALLLNLI